MKPDFFDTCVVVEASRLLIDLKKTNKLKTYITVNMWGKTF